MGLHLAAAAELSSCSLAILRIDQKPAGAATTPQKRRPALETLPKKHLFASESRVGARRAVSRCYLRKKTTRASSSHYQCRCAQTRGCGVRRRAPVPACGLVVIVEAVPHSGVIVSHCSISSSCGESSGQRRLRFLAVTATRRRRCRPTDAAADAAHAAGRCTARVVGPRRAPAVAMLPRCPGCQRLARSALAAAPSPVPSATSAASAAVSVVRVARVGVRAVRVVHLLVLVQLRVQSPEALGEDDLLPRTLRGLLRANENNKRPADAVMPGPGEQGSVPTCFHHHTPTNGPLLDATRHG